MNNPTQHLDSLRFATLVALVARTWRKTVDSRLVLYDLTDAAWVPLLYLSRMDKPIRQKDLAAMLSLDSSSLVRVLNHLEKAGHIQRVPEEHDRRAKATSITAQGREIAQHLEQMSQDLENEIKAQLNPDDLVAARRLLQQLFGILDGMHSAQKGQPE